MQADDALRDEPGETEPAGPQAGSLYGALCATAGEHPGLYALNFLGRRRSYAWLVERVDDFAAALSDAGVGKGDVVSIMLPNCPQAVVSLYAANKIGAVANMVHPLMSTGELEHALSLVGTKLLVTMDVFYDKACEAARGCVERRGGRACRMVVTKIADELPVYVRAAFRLWAKKELMPAHPVRPGEGVGLYRAFAKRGARLRRAGRGMEAPEEGVPLAEEPAVILFSGGTTGIPKGIVLSNGNVNAEAAMVCASASLPVAPGDRMLGALPLFHGFGLAVCLHTAMSSGMECLLVPRLTVKEYSRVLVRGRCNYVVGVPTLLGKIAELPGGDGLDLSFIKEVISGGDSLPAELRRRIDARLEAGGCRVRVREGYGATECTAACAAEFSGQRREGSFGRMLSGNRCKVVDPQTGRELPCGQDGELLVAGPTVMLGYWDNPSETDRCLSVDADGTRWLHTGDIVCADEEGFLFYRGRIKRMVISSGYNIYPDQIEHELDKLPEVASSCVIDVPDPYRLHRIKAFVVLAPGVEASEKTRATIFEELKGGIARYAWPKEIEFRNELPLTKVGKVAYRELEKEEAARLAAAAAAGPAGGGAA